VKNKTKKPKGAKRPKPKARPRRHKPTIRPRGDKPPFKVETTAQGDTMPKLFKVTAQGDTVYIKAPTVELAQARLTQVMGEIPADLLSFMEVDSLPAGETFL